MPMFEEHRANATPLAVGAAIVTMLVGMSYGFDLFPIIMFSALNAALVLGGAALPDVDHQDSIPRKWLGAVGGNIAVLGYLTGTIALGAYFPHPFAGILAIALALYFSKPVLNFLTSVVGSTFDSLLTHRGVTHTVEFGVVAAIVLYFASNYLLTQIGVPNEDANLVAAFCAVALGLGVLKHLSDDGL
jgi:hypothetical protein